MGIAGKRFILRIQKSRALCVSDFGTADVVSRPPASSDEANWDLSRWDDPIGGMTLDRNRNVDLLEVVKRTCAARPNSLERRTASAL
jgi:hypothetical protein